MSLEIAESLRIGDTKMGMTYRRLGNLGTSMDPTVSRSMDDRDRMDWLERSITSIRKTLGDHGIQIQDLESGHGRVMGRINDAQAATEQSRLEGIARGLEIRGAIEQLVEIGGAIEQLARTSEEGRLVLHGQISSLDERLTVADKQSQTVLAAVDTWSVASELLGKTIEALIDRIGALEGQTVQMSQALQVLNNRKPWWQFWSRR